MEKPPTRVGLYIKNELKKRGMTQIELAIRLNSNESVVRRVVGRARRVTADMAIRLERVLGLPAIELLNIQAQEELEEARRQDVCSGQSLSL
jgi:addiction module HigA family antidote